MNLLVKFQKYLEDDNNNRQTSIRGYVSDIRNFVNWFYENRKIELTEDRLKREPHLLNKAVIEAFIKNMHAKKKALTTINRYSASLRVFGRFLVGSRIAPANPAEKITFKKLHAPAPRGLTDEERHRLEYIFRTPWERQANKSGRKRELTLAPKLLVRNKAIMLMLLYAGPRVEELVKLDIEDVKISPRSGSILIRDGKGGQPREVGLPKQVREALDAWFELRKQLPGRDHAMFIDMKRDFSRLTTRAIQNMIMESAIRSGVDVSPHVLRHTYAYMLRQNGVQPEVRARLMGHSVTMAQRYGSPKDNELNDAVNSLDSESSF